MKGRAGTIGKLMLFDRIKSIIREDLAKDNIAPEMKKH